MPSWVTRPPQTRTAACTGAGTSFCCPTTGDSLPEGCYREGAPGEAVDPRTIAPKKTGAKTPRSQSGDMTAESSAR
ncbi:DUF6009 family protein [Streptomyces sp. NPDC005122]